MSTKSSFTTIKKFLLNTKALMPYLAYKIKRQPKKVESKLVFIISFPRSGTHAIGSLLTQENLGFRYYGEFFIFNAWNSAIERINHFYPYFSLRYSINLRQQRRSWQYDKFEKTSLDARKTLNAIKKISGVHIIKIFPQHLSDQTLKSLIAEFKPHIIFLRRNHLDRFVSHKKANASGKWHTAPTDDVEITLDPKEFEKFISNYTAFYQRYRNYAHELGIDVLDVDFDDLRDPEKVREIQRFAALPDFSRWEDLPKAPTTVKQDKSSKVQDDFLRLIGREHSDFEFSKVEL